MPATIIMPKTRDINDGKKIILKFDTPAIFKAIISSDWTNFKNKIIEEIKKMKGKSLYTIVGTFKNVNDRGNKNPTAWSLKKFISSNMLNIIPRAKKIRKIFIIIFENSTKKYLLNTLILNILLV